jgi:hypothetical protein
MSEYLSFKKLITPTVIQLLFWVAVFINTITALFDSGGFWNGLLELILGPILIRIFCEGLIVVFEINERLTEIRDNQLTIIANAQPAPAAPPPEPPAAAAV